MAERQTGNQQVQVGAQTVLGTGVAASKRLKSIDFTLNARGNVLTFRPQGSKLASVVVPGQEWSGGDISGMPVYDEIIYPLSMIFGAPTPTTVNTTGKQWVFTYTAGAALTPKPLTIEKGDAVRAGKAIDLIATDFGLHVTRNEVTIDGATMGTLYTDGITLTVTPTSALQIPILPASWDLYVDSTFGAIGTTKWLRGFAFDLNMGGLYSPIWPINSALTSYAAAVENAEPDINCELRVEADATGMALLTDLRAGSTKYIRAKSTSTTLVGAGPAVYSIQIDAAVKINEYSDFDDEDGLYVINYPLAVVDDTNLSLTITVVCAATAL
jgi:hypothetical protein